MWKFWRPSHDPVSQRRAMRKDVPSFFLCEDWVCLVSFLSDGGSLPGNEANPEEDKTRDVLKTEHLLHPLTTSIMPQLQACPQAFPFHKPTNFS